MTDMPVTLTRRTLLGAAAAAAGVALWVPPRLALADTGFAQIRQNWRHLLLGAAPDLSSPAIISAIDGLSAEAQGWLDTIDVTASSGSMFPDLPLGTVSASLRTSFNRVLTIGRAYATPGTTLHGDEAAASTAREALNTLLTTFYVPSLPPRGYDNWWDWQIGIPGSLLNSAITFEESVGSPLLSVICDRIDHFVPDATAAGGTGANLMDWCRILILRGAVAEEADRIEYALQIMRPGMEFTRYGDGLHEDGSFLQHTARLAYLNAYGLTYFTNIGNLAAILGGGPWELPESAIGDVHLGLDRGVIPATWNGLALDTLRGRGTAGEVDQDHDSGLRAVLVLLMFADGTSDPVAASRWRAAAKGWLTRATSRPLRPADGIANITRCQEVLSDTSVAAAPEPPGATIWPDMDRAVFRGQGWAVAIAGSSDRIGRYESVLEQNRRGWYTGDGMTMLYVDADNAQFNDNFWNTVDFLRLPGVTNEQLTLPLKEGANTQPDTTFCGGAAIDTVAVFAQQIHNVRGMRANKSWVMLNDEVVAIGSAITSTTGERVLTTIDSRNDHTAPRAIVVDGEGVTGGATGSWAQLQGVGGYMMRSEGELSVQQADHTGSWADNNAGEDDTPVTRPYTTLTIDHGVDPDGAGYVYSILPTASASRTAYRATSRLPQVLAANELVHLVASPEPGLVAATFFGAASAAGYTASGPCVVVVEQHETDLVIAISDPGRTQATVTVELPTPAGGPWEVVSGDGVHVLANGDSLRLLAEVGGVSGGARRVVMSSGEATAPVGAQLIPASADAYVRSGTYADSSYGSTDLRVRASDSVSYARVSLVRFTVGDIAGDVGRAILWMHARVADTGGNATQLRAVAVGSEWTESEVTWNTMPELGDELDTGWITVHTEWVGLDVTDAVSNAGDVSFAITGLTPATSLLSAIDSRESGLAPVLQVVSSGGTVEPPADDARPEVVLRSPSSAGPVSSIEIEVDASDAVGLQKIVANVYSGGVLVKSTQTAVDGLSATHSAVVTVPDGNYTIKYNAHDRAGNTSKTSTFDVRVDATPPTVTVKAGEQFTIERDGGYERVSYKLHDAGKIDRAVLNGTVIDLSDNTWSDLNFIRPGTFGGVLGENTLTVYDVAGNATEITFTLV